MYFVGSVRNFDHLQEAIDAVSQKIETARSEGTTKVKAAAGLILTRETKSGETEVLMGRLNKLDRPKPKDDAGVHDSYGLFAGGVELTDAGSAEPAVVMATAREVEEESLGALSQEIILNLLSLSTTKLIKNAGWKHFPAASFHVNISREEGERIVDVFNKAIGSHPQHEISDLAWISLTQIFEAQTAKEEQYNALKSQLEAERGHPFTADELRGQKDLGVVYNTNVSLSSGIQIAHFVARTLFGDKDSLQIKIS